MTIIKNSLPAQIAMDGILHRLTIEAGQKYAKHHTALESDMKILIQETLKKFSLEYQVDVNFTFSSSGTVVHKNVRDPHFVINHLIDEANGKPFDLFSRNIFVNIAGEWIHSKKYLYGNWVSILDLDCAKAIKYVNLDHLAEACAFLTEKTNCRVEHAQYDVVKADGLKIPRTHDDLLNNHPGSRIAAYGDKWAIVQTKKGNLIVYYSTNGHGFGYDTVVMPEKPVNDFYNWLGDKQYRQMIIPGNVLKKLDARGP